MQSNDIPFERLLFTLMKRALANLDKSLLEAFRSLGYDSDRFARMHANLFYESRPEIKWLLLRTNNKLKRERTLLDISEYMRSQVCYLVKRLNTDNYYHTRRERWG